MNVGRAFFFQEEPERLECVVLITLESHTANVVALAEAWGKRTPTHSKVIEAARIHDDAKPSTFHVTYSRSYDRLSYSFRGHRFRVSHPDPYVELLVRLHHEFSVDGITEAQARLRQQGSQPEDFPYDLYTLEMCDQIAAEAELYAFDLHPDHRVFMDFHSELKSDSPTTVALDPFPFTASGGLNLRIRYRKIAVDAKTRKDLKKEIKEKSKRSKSPTLESLPRFERFLWESWERVKEQEKEVHLCPLG